MEHVVEGLLCKWGALTSNPRPTKKSKSPQNPVLMIFFSKISKR
jgi:hypothetical protein